MNYYGQLKICLLSYDCDISELNIKIEDVSVKTKEKYGIKNIKIITQEMNISEIFSKKNLFLSLYDGTLYVTNRNLMEIVEYCERSIIFLLGREYYFSCQVFNSKTNFFIVGLHDFTKTQKNFPTIYLQGYVNINSNSVKLENIVFEMNNQNGNYNMSMHLCTGGLIFNKKTESVKIKNCQFNKSFNNRCNFLVLNGQENVSFKNCQINDGSVQFNLCQNVILMGNHWSKSSVEYHTTNGLMHGNIFEQTHISVFNSKTTNILYNQFTPDINNQYTQINIDYSSFVIINNNYFKSIDELQSTNEKLNVIAEKSQSTEQLHQSINENSNSIQVPQLINESTELNNQMSDSVGQLLQSPNKILKPNDHLKQLIDPPTFTNITPKLIENKSIDKMIPIKIHQCFNLFNLDRNSTAIASNNFFDHFESLAKVEWKSRLTLISNQFKQNFIDLAFSSGKIKTDGCNFNINSNETKKEITINVNQKNIRKPNKIVCVI